MTDPNSFFGQVQTTVMDRFSQGESMSQAAYQTTIGALQNLAAAVQGLQLIARTIPIDTTIISTGGIDVNAPELDPAKYTVNVPPMPTEPTTPEPTLDAMPEFPELTAGDLQTPQVNAYSSTLLTAIRAKILSELNTLSYEQAIADRGRERETLDMEDAIDKIAADWGRRGYAVPHDGMVDAIASARIQFGYKRMDQDREAIIKGLEIGLHHMEVVLQAGVAIETEMIRWALGAAKLVADAAEALIRLQIEAFKGRVDAVAAKAKVIVEKMRAQIEHNRAMIEAFLGKISGFSAQVKGEADRVTAVAAGDTAAANLFKSIADVKIADAGLNVEVLKARVQQALNNANILIQDKNIEARNAELINSLRERAAEAIAQIGSQIVSGALAGVSAGAKIGADASVNESHTYEEKKIFQTGGSTT